MSKFRPYNSPLKRLLSKFGPLGNFISNTYYKLNKFDDFHDSVGAEFRNESLAPEFLGAFHPFFSLAKDVADTFKPYKSDFYIWRDILQPLRGIGNIIKGAAYLIVTPILFFHDIFRAASYYGKANGILSTFTSLLGLSFVRVFAGLFDGLNNIVRGVLQIVTTPLVFPRMLLRGAITAFKGKPTFEDTQRENAEKLEALVEKKDKTQDDTLEIDYQMQRLRQKIDKAEKRGQVFVNKDLKETFDCVINFTNSRSFRESLLLNYHSQRIDNHEITNARRFLGLFTGNVPKEQEPEARRFLGLFTGNDQKEQEPQHTPFYMRE